MSILDNIQCAADLQQIEPSQLPSLAEEIRNYIINTVSRTGGHLASSLGAVELCIALNRVYDPLKDRILFDVGHQTYAHKIINGRKDSFQTLRTFGGISGFPKPYESPADAFIAGHSSDSISVAYGMAKARTLLNEDYDVCAVIGDGALTGGLAYEGLENVAASGEPMLIILNDNAMSINGNVGGMSRMLQKLRTKPEYFEFKRKYRNLLGIDSDLYLFNHKLKEKIKDRILPGNMFSDMGLEYLGPIDGHDVNELENTIRWAKEMKKPVLLHVITVKGKGCSYAEAHPMKYHGVGPFNPQSGELVNSAKGFGDYAGSFLCEFAKNDERIVALTAAMTEGTGLRQFSTLYPSRFFDVGIAEGHAVSMCAGMAKQGLIPIFAVYSSFLQRGYDMLIHDVALQNLHVVFCIDRAGVVGRDGETHNGVFDVTYLSSIPNMSILCPSSVEELRDMLRIAIYEYSGPVAVRYPRGGEGAFHDSVIATEQILVSGTDVTIPCYGIMVNSALQAAKLLSEKGIHAEVVKIGAICPSDYALTVESIKKTGKLLVAEDVCDFGCVGHRILASASRFGVDVESYRFLNMKDGFAPHGSVDEIMHLYHLNAEDIADAAMEMMS